VGVGETSFAGYVPVAISEFFSPVLNAMAFNVLPNTMGAGPCDAFIICGPVGFGVELSSVQVKLAPGVVVVIMTSIGFSFGPGVGDGLNVGVAQVSTAIFEQAGRIASARAAEIRLATVFMCRLGLSEQALLIGLSIFPERPVNRSIPF
jgi:hypothetical protein